MERLPTEVAITDTLRRFKAIPVTLQTDRRSTP
jgi:hypothetical protein